MKAADKHSLYGWRALAACAALIALGARAAPLEGTALTEALEHGGFVLVMRHASSPRTPPELGAAQTDNLPVERELDEIGRATARAMGEAIHRRRIPIGELWSSPTYRARQTIKVAGLGEPKLAPELGDGGQGMGADSGAARSAWLRHKATETPRVGTNTLLVTHMPVITAAFPDAGSIADGEILVFRPDGTGNTVLAARIKIEDWPRL